MAKYLMTKEGRGRELMLLLSKELGIPAQSVWFEVRFAEDALVTVKCEYFPNEFQPVGVDQNDQS
jgi:hypothetical protein